MTSLDSSVMTRDSHGSDYEDYCLLGCDVVYEIGSSGTLVPLLDYTESYPRRQ
jgi:hypothetical protein